MIRLNFNFLGDNPESVVYGLSLTEKFEKQALLLQPVETGYAGQPGMVSIQSVL